MEFSGEKWIKIYKDNYNGLTEQAKDLENYIKSMGKASYIPWATMERMIYEQDPTAEFEVLTNGISKVWTDEGIVRTYKNKEGEITELNIPWLSHFVKIKVTFYGKIIIEDYPIQEIVKNEGYVASKNIDQNMVNKAIQRAKAKAASRVSGLALKLYESKDLQFEDDKIDEPKNNFKSKEEKQKEIKNVKEFEIPKKEEPKKEEPKKEIEIKETIPEFLNYAKYMIENKNKLIPIIQKLNTNVASTYGFTFNLDDKPEIIAKQLEQVKNGKVFFKSIMKQSGFKDNEINKIIGE